MKIKVRWPAGEQTLNLDKRFYDAENFLAVMKNELKDGVELVLDPSHHPFPDDYISLEKLIDLEVTEVEENV